MAPATGCTMPFVENRLSSNTTSSTENSFVRQSRLSKWRSKSLADGARQYHTVPNPSTNDVSTKVRKYGSDGRGTDGSSIGTTVKGSVADSGTSVGDATGGSSRARRVNKTPRRFMAARSPA